jgi:uncharacterized phiE125 gp8 family phage protein
MAAYLLTPPAIEPWTLAEAKAFLRVETDDDDAVVASLIAAARSQVEALTRKVMLAQTWRVVLDEWPRDGRIRAGVAPVTDVIAARVFDSDGNSADIDLERFLCGTMPGIIVVPMWSMPVPGRTRAGIEIDVAAGFGAAADDVPQLLRNAVRTLAAHWYDNRGLVAIGGSVAMLPGSVSAMIASYRTLYL